MILDDIKKLRIKATKAMTDRDTISRFVYESAIKEVDYLKSQIKVIIDEVVKYEEMINREIELLKVYVPTIIKVTNDEIVSIMNELDLTKKSKQVIQELDDIGYIDRYDKVFVVEFILATKGIVAKNAKYKEEISKYLS